MISLIKYPKRTKGLLLALVASLAVHGMTILVMRYGPILQMAMGFRELEYVDEEYNRAILIDFTTKKLKYPPGYIGFQAPQKVRSLEEMKKEEARRAQLEAARRKAEEERRRKEEEEIARREAEEKAREQALAQAAPKPTPTTPPAPADGYGRFGKINTAPIKDQIQRLYDAKNAGALVIPGKLRVGVEGAIAPDGRIASYRLTVPSGIEEIDQAAKAILDAVSESRALGVLTSLTSLSMVLDIDQTAELRVVGFTGTEQEAADIASLAQAALLIARYKKAGEPAAMVMLNNLKIVRTGTRIQATISVSREKAQQTLANSFDKPAGPAQKPNPEQHEWNAVE